MSVSRGLVIAAALLSCVYESAYSLPEEYRNTTCPTWLYQSKQGWCTCGSSLLNKILCSNISQEVSIDNSLCLTSFNPDDNKVAVGRCLYAQNHQKYSDGNVYGVYIDVDKNITQQDEQLCGYLNREGRLCGRCKYDHFISAYSYDLKCYQSHEGLLWNIALYLCVAYVPLTIFLAIVVIFHISVSTPHLNLAILLCQSYAHPTALRVLTQLTRDKKYFVFVQVLASLYGVWNLDFFRTLIPPICLPLNTLQVIVLDYFVAVYPLFLLFCIYILVRAHDRGCRLVVRLSRPFLWCSARTRNARDSIVDAFVTFILLSYLKFINVSGDLLIPTQLYNIHGSLIGNFIYYDATIEFMGPQHMPYFISAIVVVIAAISLPLLLFLYPMLWFQNGLNKCHLNSPGLRIFMDCFQGYYRDRSDGGWDCRYFSAIYPALRIVGVILYDLTRSNILFPLEILINLPVVLILLWVHPYKKQFTIYNKIDILLLSSLTAFCASMTAAFNYFDWDELLPTMAFIMGGIISLIPFLYLALLNTRRMRLTLIRGYISASHNTLQSFCGRNFHLQATRFTNS